jgi:hypothetical protein
LYARRSPIVVAEAVATFGPSTASQAARALGGSDGLGEVGPLSEVGGLGEVGALSEIGALSEVAGADEPPFARAFGCEVHPAMSASITSTPTLRMSRTLVTSTGRG